MATIKNEAESVPEPTKAYSCVGGQPYHYPEGVLVPGESKELTASQAARGLASGLIALTPEPSKES